MDKSSFILGGGGGINFKYLIISYYCGGIFVFFQPKCLAIFQIFAYLVNHELNYYVHCYRINRGQRMFCELWKCLHFRRHDVFPGKIWRNLPSLTISVSQVYLKRPRSLLRISLFSRFITKQRTTIPPRDGPLTGMGYPPLKDFPAMDYSCLSISLAV